MASTSSNGEIDAEKWKEVYKELEKNYAEAYFKIDKAIKFDEEGKSNKALPLYESGLSLIDKALELPLNEPSKPDVSWEKAIVMTQKLRKSRKEIILRIDNVKSMENSLPSVPELPPSYEEVVSNLSKSVGTSSNGNNFQLPGPSKDTLYIPPSAIQDQELLANLHANEEASSESFPSYYDLSQQLKEMKLAKNEEILFRCDNVKLYFISPDGRVSSTLESHILLIARIYDETSNVLDEALLDIVSDLSRDLSKPKHKKHRRHHLHRKRHHHKDKTHKHGSKDEAQDPAKRTFLQVGSWLYPLIPEVSPCYRSEAGAFIFPDIHSDIEGAAVGIVLPEEANEQVHELFIHLLNEETTGGRSKRNVVTDSFPDNFSSKMVRGATYLAHSLVKGAGSTARFIDTSTPKIIDWINPTAEQTQINPTLQKTVSVAKAVSGKAVDVTDYLATKIGMATSALGRYLSPYIQKQGTRLLAAATNMQEEEALEKMNSMMNVTWSAVEGISTIYNGFGTAGSILANSLANNTVQIIEHKYGQPAGALTSDAITTFGNVYYTHHNFRVLKPRGIAKAAVKGAGVALMEDYRSSKTKLKPHDEFEGSGPGDGSGFNVL